MEDGLAEGMVTLGVVEEDGGDVGILVEVDGRKEVGVTVGTVKYRNYLDTYYLVQR